MRHESHSRDLKIIVRQALCHDQALKRVGKGRFAVKG
jgi:hypothetical protein